MANPYGMAEFNAPGLIDVYRQGRADRVRDLETNRQETRRDALAKIFSPQQAQQGPSEPTSLVDPSKLPPRTDGLQINQDALRELYRADPEYAMEVQKWAYNANKQQFDQAKGNGRLMASLAAQLRTVPPEQRQQALGQLAPQLSAMGFAPEQLAQADLTDAGLTQYERIGSLLDKIEGKGPELRNVGPGEVVYDVRSGQKAFESPYIKGADGTLYERPGGSAPTPRIADRAAYDALPPGTAYIAPDGTTRTKPGGPTQPASGSFPR